jgi:hypothetical protein
MATHTTCTLQVLVTPKTFPTRCTGTLRHITTAVEFEPEFEPQCSTTSIHLHLLYGLDGDSSPTPVGCIGLDEPLSRFVALGATIFGGVEERSKT